MVCVFAVYIGTREQALLGHCLKIDSIRSLLHNRLKLLMHLLKTRKNNTFQRYDFLFFLSFNLIFMPVQ